MKKNKRNATYGRVSFVFHVVINEKAFVEVKQMSARRHAVAIKHGLSSFSSHEENQAQHFSSTKESGHEKIFGRV